MVDDWESTQEPDAKVVDILKINMYIFAKILSFDYGCGINLGLSTLDDNLYLQQNMGFLNNEVSFKSDFFLGMRAHQKHVEVFKVVHFSSLFLDYGK